MSVPTSFLSVTQLTQLIKHQIEHAPALNNVYVKGEISNFTLHSSKHMYFTLKDSTSKMKCVMFQGYASKLKFMPKDGTQVIAFGNISLFERDGNVQLYVTQMQPDGLGSLYLAYEQLKRKLELEGLFDPRQKKAIPTFPKTVGVITSETGAVLRDIRTTLARRYPLASVLLYPVQVQGVSAADSIARAIRIMNELQVADVLIVGRGGGSIEELWAFNEEVVARAIAASNIPIISAVGHETDVTIADFVADQRAATPTAAAELCSPDIFKIKRDVMLSRNRMESAVKQILSIRKQRLLTHQRSAALREPKQRVYLAMERVDRMQDLMHTLIRERIRLIRDRVSKMEQILHTNHPVQRIRLLKQELSSRKARIVLATPLSIKKNKQLLLGVIRTLDALSPLKVMERGYSLVYEKAEQQLVKSINQVQIGHNIQVRLQDGNMNCTVTGVEESR